MKSKADASTIATSPHTTRMIRDYMTGGNGSMTGGNGSPAPEPDRLARIETMLERLQQTLDTQFERIAQIQAQLDRAITDGPLTR